MRILFFGDGIWAANSLRRLVEDGRDIVGVVIRVQPSDTSLAETASRSSLPIFQPKRVNSPEFVSKVLEIGPELNLSASYDQILRKAIIQAASQGFINFHAGKLPYYRGRNVINWAIINGETEIGLTAHYVDEGIDTGDIVLQRTLPIAWTDTYGDVLSRVISAFPDLVADAVKLLASGQAERQPQSHLAGTYYSRREEGDEWLDWSDSTRNIYNKIRAITRPGPGAQTILDGETVTIWHAFYDPDWPSYLATPGQVVGRQKGEGVFVKTGDCTLLLQEVQIGDSLPEVPSWSIGVRLGVNLMSYLHKLEARVSELEQQLEPSKVLVRSHL